MNCSFDWNNGQDTAQITGQLKTVCKALFSEGKILLAVFFLAWMKKWQNIDLMCIVKVMST